MQKQPDSTATTVNPNSVETDAAELRAWGVEVPLSHSVMLTCCHCSLCLGHTSSTIGALAVPIAHPELCFSSRYSEDEQKLKCELSVCQLALSEGGLRTPYLLTIRIMKEMRNLPSSKTSQQTSMQSGCQRAAESEQC